MENISGFGVRIRLTASNTFPNGFDLSQFSDDSDPFNISDIDIANAEMGLNGDPIVWSVASLIEKSISLIPDSEDDQNMAVLFEANRVARGKRGAADTITAVIVYPDDRTVTFGNGIIVSGPPASGIASSGRKNTKTYGLRFGSLSRS